MKVILNAQAKRALKKITDFVESRNTPGAGDRYAKKFLAAIDKLAQPNVEYALCNNDDLALLKFCCGHYNNWVIIFKVEKSVFKVYRILHGPTVH